VETETRETIKTGINNDLEAMSSIDQLCGRVSMLLAETISVLLNSMDTPRLNELERICNELFDAAREAKAMRRNLQ
jgi:hypothetical protein